ncbi:putative ureide permease [Helianthus anomalus]
MDQPRFQKKDLENGSVKVEKAKVGTANFLIELESRRAIKSVSHFSRRLLILQPILDDGVPHLSVYIAFFYFLCSCFVIAIILNITFLYCPAFNLPRSSIKAYLNDWDGRGWRFWLDFYVVLGMVSTLWEVKLLVMLQLMQFRQIVEKNIRVSHRHAFHVYCGCWSSNGVIWTPKTLNTLCRYLKIIERQKCY